MKYNTCPVCGAHLDFGERCDCADAGRQAEARTGTPKGGEDNGGETTPASGEIPRNGHPAVRMG